MVDNMELWNKVWKTDPNFTKGAKVGGRSITAIQPQYQIRRATELWGPMGCRWGVSNVKWHVEEALGTKAVIMEIDLWYPSGVVKSVFGSAKLAYVSSKGRDIFDDDAWKKARTDATTKGLSMLGFNADVFLGLWDDSKYHEWRASEEKAPPPRINDKVKPKELKLPPKKDTGLDPALIAEIAESLNYTGHELGERVIAAYMRAESNDNLRRLITWTAKQLGQTRTFPLPAGPVGAGAQDGPQRKPQEGTTPPPGAGHPRRRGKVRMP